MLVFVAVELLLMLSQSQTTFSIRQLLTSHCVSSGYSKLRVQLVVDVCLLKSPLVKMTPVFRSILYTVDDDDDDDD